MGRGAVCGPGGGHTQRFPPWLNPPQRPPLHRELEKPFERLIYQRRLDVVQACVTAYGSTPSGSRP